jgi:hypothetical protein
MKDVLYLEVIKQDEPVVRIGSWKPPGERIDNFDQQRDIGWHIMFAFQQGAREVRVVRALPREEQRKGVTP